MEPMESIDGEDIVLPSLTHVRDIEAFEGPILSERRASDGSTFVEKWCTRSEGTHRCLLVEVDRVAIVEYVMRSRSLLSLLQADNDTGYLVDYAYGIRVRTRRVRVSTLPGSYLPEPSAMHDLTLAPPDDE
jgi:hypothetical protein